MLNTLQRTDCLEGSRSPINNIKSRTIFFHCISFFFTALNATEIQCTTEMSLELPEVRIFTLSRRSFDCSCYHATHQANLRHFPFPIPDAYLLHIAPELPDVLGHGGGDSTQLGLFFSTSPFLFLPLLLMVPDDHAHNLWEQGTRVKTLQGQSPAPSSRAKRIIKSKKSGKSELAS